jgi:lipoprotein-anchoring transpeptidase ErfK/SrfK
MRDHFILPIVAIGMGLIGLRGAQAAGQGPLVIPGVGPETYAATPAPVRQREASNSGYGGGFLELLMTGRDPTQSRREPAPRAYQAPQAYQVPQTYQAPQAYQAPVVRASSAPQQRAAYAPPAEPVSAVQQAISPEFMRQEVDYRGPHGAGTIVVDTPSRHLYLVQGNGRALRYGIGVGRPGFEWAGAKTITRKAEWPGWTPPPEMLLRRPDLPRHMDGGPQNPLGARAMYLGSTMYRIHGTNEPYTIGQNVSSGCIRMMNEDVTDLYDRVKVGTRVVVM